MKFESHPGKKLITHLNEVEEYAKTFLKEDTDTNKALEIICRCHDFGKYTTYFQQHLYGEFDGELSYHGFVSALFAAFIGLEMFGDDVYLPLILYTTILYHHGNLENVTDALPYNIKFNMNTLRNDLKAKLRIVDKQLNDMDNNFDYIYKELKELSIHEYFKSFIEQREYERILRRLFKIVRKINRNKIDKEKIYVKHQLLYSALIDADKLSASNTPLPNYRTETFENLYSVYNKTFKSSKGKLSDIRSEVFKKIQESILKGYKDNKYFSITAPTGTGKTLAGFYAAKKLCELLDDNRKIIYALPFTSIIDQNYSVIQKLHKEVDNFKENYSQYIIKHHHLSDVEYKSNKKAYDIDSSILLMEGWQSSIIVTTFIQFFETLIGYKNRMLKKFHSLKGAVIILDELQTIDIKYWKLIDYALKKLCNELDCRIITMTATRPIILQDSYELLDNFEEYFKRLDRVNLVFDRKSITIEEFCNTFIEAVEDKSYLIICNTIKQSLKIYDKLKALDREVLYLSTNLVPRQRRKRINKIQKIMELKPIVISTQVVEAGVDLDFDIVYRDLAPLDCIIQAAGRCNRNGENKGEVRVIKMVNEGKIYSSYVYGKLLPQITEEILAKSYFKESEFLEIIKEYFKSALERSNSVDDSIKFIQAMENLEFDKIKEFSLIENRPNYIDVYFEVDKKAKCIFENYKKRVLKEDDKSKRYKALLRLKPKLREYIISLPKDFYREFIEEKNIFRMSIEDRERTYKDDIGFNREVKNETFIL
ncbi:CRISPR-associated helicase/endonuclease Cas3 [Paramaledivibacter caminithermalis]|uniref:CRISPR-associated helicase, Cas3 family n=1 Tax=Paramaledivibacter caminithermalis (strain DSM 15212 / CIP 107654 / DViRD3) TaxID=1121301 RepID=A0A1M6KPE3_PARC5|nr:CRISPR-associated helicase/endonuclease Cas3 [Paramaledivibacter caminithermalis]SHJ60873.1 CRISPR-associated helicase, Cas3 family [Paramaledivibacter caminithermalis DSM 15212]